MTAKKNVLLLMGVWLLATAGIGLVTNLGLGVLSAVRAYVGGEGLWSKSQKDAVNSLHRYAETRNAADFVRYEECITVPLGDRKAREELEKPIADLAVADRGFLEGHNHPQDVRAMSLLFRRYSRFPYLSQAIHIWREGDREIATLIEAAARLHKAIAEENAPLAKCSAILQEIDATNRRATVLEDRFSSTLGEGARWVRNAALWLMIGSNVFILSLGGLCVRHIVAQIVVADLRRQQAIVEQSVSERRYKYLLESSLGLIYLHDLEGVLISVNPATAHALGYEPANLEGRNLRELLNPDGAAIFPAYLAQWRHCKEASGLLTVFRRNGERRVWSYRNVLYSELEGPPYVIGFAFDVTETVRLEQQQRDSNAFLRQVIDINPHFVFAKDRKGRFTLVNRAVAEAYGTTVEQLVGKTDADFNPNSEEVEHFLRDDLEVMDTVREKVIAEEPITDASGRVRWLHTVKRPLVGANGTADQVLGVSTDISRHKELQAELVRGAFYDKLTSLPNRALFLDRLGQALARTSRDKAFTFAVLFLDLDRFKVVNDSLGHSVGDDLLRAFAERLEWPLRRGDTAARLGGDEFAVLLENASLVDATRLVERIRNQLKEPLRLGTREVFTSASIGTALSSPSYGRPDEILRDADTAMYRAKARGPAGHEVFDQTMHTAAVELLRTETDLRRAVERGELEVFYQPIVELATGRPVACEALLRWRHLLRGLLKPEDFLSVAEETGLIVPIGNWVLEEVCRELQTWRKLQERFSASVNLSGRQLADLGLIDSVTTTMEAHGLPAESLCVEVTEHSVIKHRGTGALHRLRELAIRVHLDDFGTGYSSLVYLQRLPIDTLKIDRSFVGQLGTEGEGPLVPAILGLAKSLGLSVVAEGVETEVQARRLLHLGCGYAQGHFYSLPLAARELTALLEAGGSLP